MSQQLWTYAALAGVFGAEAPVVDDVEGVESVEGVEGGDEPAGITGISIDTRTLSPGDMFVALDTSDSGGRDGHTFIDAALEKGAAALLIEKDQGKDFSIPVYKVADTTLALADLGRAARSRFEGKVVGITGSSGKTTMRAWCEALLGEAWETTASVGSYNNHWGVPLSLARAPASVDFGIFEIGTNHPGEIAPLSELVSPDVAVLINVLPAHIGNFASMQALETEKLSIAAGLDQSGTLIVPASLRERVTHTGQVISIGEGGDINGTIQPAAHGATVQVTAGEESLSLDIPFYGDHRLQSVLVAVGILKGLNVDVRDVADRFMQLPLPAGRGLTHVAGGMTVIDDSYNANPVSMRHAIKALEGNTTGSRIALLGELLELGDGAKAAHDSVAASCEGLDRVYTFGDGFAGVDFPACHDGHFATAGEFDLVAFCQSLTPGDTVLIKGSNKVFWTSGFTGKLLQTLEPEATARD